MSATLMGAVLGCGPKKGSLRYVLVAIADNADDYGFACPSIETIAEKACCDARTAMRLVQQLEREGWMRVVRRVIFGKGSVYFIDIARLGITVNAKMRKSPLHAEVAKSLEKKAVVVAKSGDNLSRENLRAPETSGDNPQGGQVTKTAESGDKKPFPILKNRNEPSLNPDNSPLPPSRGGGGDPVPEVTPKAENGTKYPAEATTRNAASPAIGGHACPESVRKVMRECSLSDPRLERVIARAMTLEHSKSDAPPECNQTAERMIASWQAFSRDAHLMRYTVGPRKFFADGLWLGLRWPYDQPRLREARRL